MTDSKALVDKLWNYCNVLRDDGLSYGDYVEQLTYLLFLKMADEQQQLGLARIVPEGLDWPSLLKLSRRRRSKCITSTILNELGKQTDMLGVIFRKAQNRIQDPAKLQRLIHDLIDGETWMGLDVDVKGDAYEGLLERNAADTKSGAGQYFTPRALISAMVDVMQPTPDMRICDPACGTGGFFLAAYDYIIKHNPHLDSSTETAPTIRCVHRVGDRRQHGSAGCDEHAAPRHRVARERQPGPRRRRTTRRSRRTVRPRADEPAVREEVLGHDRERRGQGRSAEPDSRA